MREFRDHYDDEGYRAYLASDDESLLIAFGVWLDQQGIGCQLVVVEEHDELDCVWTDWITDKGKAALLKLTWGGK